MVKRRLHLASWVLRPAYQMPTIGGLRPDENLCADFVVTIGELSL
jgi:hypothetical protein